MGFFGLSLSLVLAEKILTSMDFRVAVVMENRVRMKSKKMF